MWLGLLILDSHETSLSALNPYRHTNASCICRNTEISGLVGSKGLIKVFILTLIVRRGKNGPNTLNSECYSLAQLTPERVLNRVLVFLDCPLKWMLFLPFPARWGGMRLHSCMERPFLPQCSGEDACPVVGTSIKGSDGNFCCVSWLVPMLDLWCWKSSSFPSSPQNQGFQAIHIKNTAPSHTVWIDPTAWKLTAEETWSTLWQSSEKSWHLSWPDSHRGGVPFLIGSF